MNERTLRLMRFWLLIVCLLGLGLQQTPAVFAQSYTNTFPVAMAGALDDRPRVLMVTIDRNMWVTYDTELGNLFRVWTGGLEDPSLRFSSFLAERPTVQGLVLFENEKKQKWRVIRKGEVLVPEVSLLGYRWMGEDLIIEYELTTSYGHQIQIEERPKISLDVDYPVLKRSFRVFNAPEDIQVGLEVSAEKIKELSDLKIEGVFQRYAEKKHSYYWGTAIDVHGRLILDKNTSTSISITFSPGIVANTEVNATLETSTIPSLRAIRTTDSNGVQPVLRRRSDHEVGISMKVYGIGEPIERLAELAPGQLPNVNQVVHGIDLMQKEQFGGLDFYFITHLSGYLNIAAPGDFDFQVLADDGVRLTVAGKVLLEKDGLQAAQPSETATVNLPAGVHPIKVEHFQSTGRKQLTVRWKPPWRTTFEVLEAPVLSTRKEEQRFASTSRKYIKRPLVADSLQLAGVKVDGLHPSMRIEEITIPNLDGFIGGLDVLSNGRLVLATWKGEGRVVVLEGDLDTPGVIKVKEIASGLNVPLGLEVVDDEIFVLQQHELTQLIDNDGNELIDEYRVVSNKWEVSTDYTELAVGLEYNQGHFLGALGMPLDREGAILIEDIHHRGVLVRIGFDGSQQIIGAGMQISGGIAMEHDLIAMSDQRNPWFSDSRVLFLPAKASLPHEGNESGYVTLSSIWLPINPGQSPAQPFYIGSGPYEHDWLVGDMVHTQVYRMSIDRVEQHIQGAVFPFSSNLPISLNRLVEVSDGSIFAGGSSMEEPWGTVQDNSAMIYRISVEDEQAFEMKTIHAVEGGFNVEFTKALDQGMIEDNELFTLYQWPNSETRRDRTRKRSERERLQIHSLEWLEGGTVAHISVEGLKPGHIVYFNVSPDMKSADGDRLWSNEAWYSMNVLIQTASGAP